MIRFSYLFYSSLVRHHTSDHTEFTTTLYLQPLNEFRRLLHAIINLIRIRTLSNRRLRTRLATRLAPNNWRDSASPLGSVGTSGFVLLFIMSAFIPS
jgi:hypothetical protein